MLKTILFDFDYTLVDSSEGIVHCFKTATDQLGLDRKDAIHIKKTIGLPLKEMFRALYSENYELVDIFVGYYTKEADKSATRMTYFYEDASAILQALKTEGYNLGIVSTKNRSRIQEMLKAYDLNDLFDIIVGGEDVTNHKPSPEGILQAMNRLDCGSKETIYIGDSIYDYHAAQNAAVKFIAVLNGETSQRCFEELGQNSSWIASNLTEVLALIVK